MGSIPLQALSRREPTLTRMVTGSFTNHIGLKADHEVQLLNEKP
jgi:hypothetical protein